MTRPGTFGASGEELAALVERCREGHAEAWRTVVDQLTPSVVAVGRSLGLSGRDCEDLCQSTWVHAVRAVDVLQQPERLRTWIVTVARREGIKQMLAVSHQIPTEGVEEDREALDSGPEEAVLARAEDGRVRSAVRRLPPHHRELLALLLAEPAPSYDEIADRLDIPRGSIGPTRGRILRRLRSLLEG
ncbi:RNA polymerase sigma factor [Actinomycetospora aeridis]|uniref:Sigma-70 family RNA polymerase sigma factor n=1 Tax=Actinomycetospora aeridis TaxID=3129231 RepID=A0ABU8N7Y0_9PSEU